MEKVGIGKCMIKSTFHYTNFLRICRRATLNLLQNCSEPALNLLRTCSKPAANLLRTCREPAPNLSRTCFELALNLLQTCSEHAPNLLRAYFGRITFVCTNVFSRKRTPYKFGAGLQLVRSEFATSLFNAM